MTFPANVLDSGLFSAPGDKILLPLMGYPSERDAMFIAIVTAEYFGTNLYVFHQANNSAKTEEYFYKELEWLKAKAQEFNVNLDIVVKEKKMRPDEAILAEINELSPKLTIMMSRRKGLFQRFAGSIAERVARRSHYSVMIIRSPVKDWVTYGTHVEPRKIVVPIGSNNPCEISAVQIAIALANAGRSQDADITLLHVIVVPETVPYISNDDKMIIEEEKEFIKLAGMYTTMLLYPMNARAIVGRDLGRSVSHYVNKENADLAIMGVPYIPRRLFGLFGTDTNEIYHKSKCPVVVIFHKDLC